jgi:starch-binding outer membrane protein, SusD/RagB family
MKKFSIYVAALGLMTISCNKVIDLYPESQVTTASYYTNLAELKAGVAACYNGLQNPMNTEWMLTELRSDNSKQGVTGSSSAPNRELNELDMFYLNSTHQQVYNYWLATYYNIRNTNIVLQKLGVTYNASTGATSFAPINIPITEAEKKQLAGEALIIRAHHYFNLVRLFGGVFLVQDIVSPIDARNMNRSSVEDLYKFIQADLQLAIASMNTLKYNQVASADLGRLTGWTAKGLLAKVYLTLNKKAEAITLLNDIKNNSGHSLVTAAGSSGSAYANVFAASNEVNAEIMFAVRYKGGGLGLGSPFANRFGPLNTGSAVVPGDGQGLNYPTADLDSTIKTGDVRKGINAARYITGANTKTYPRKYFPNPNPAVNPQSMTSNDAETDWIVLRYADVLLMLAEAQGNSTSSIDLINQVRTRSGAPTINAVGITTTKLFEDTLSNERRIEFAFENHRWFDLVRYGTTMTTINAVDAIRTHFEKEYPVHYKDYPAPALTLAQLQANVTLQKLLLPIPQREIDTNTHLVIPQNPGY